MSNIVNSINRWWANGQNFLDSLIKEGEITEKTTVKDLLELVKHKQEKYPRI